MKCMAPENRVDKLKNDVVFLFDNERKAFKANTESFADDILHSGGSVSAAVHKYIEDASLSAEHKFAMLRYYINGSMLGGSREGVVLFGERELDSFLAWLLRQETSLENSVYDAAYNAAFTRATKACCFPNVSDRHLREISNALFDRARNAVACERSSGQFADDLGRALRRFDEYLSVVRCCQLFSS